MTIKLKTETLRVLSNNDLHSVVGGATYSIAPPDRHRDERAPRAPDRGNLSDNFPNLSSRSSPE